jgi:hypothetical protein
MHFEITHWTWGKWEGAGAQASRISLRKTRNEPRPMRRIPKGPQVFGYSPFAAMDLPRAMTVEGGTVLRWSPGTISRVLAGNIPMVCTWA